MATLDMAPPVGGMLKQLSNSTSLPSNSGKVRLTCPICENVFVRHAAWAKRANVNYCGRGCVAIGQRVRVECFCTVCQASMMVIPANVGKKTTCGPVCSSVKKRSRGTPTKKQGFAAYKRAMQGVIDRSICEKCGTNVGPWVVRGIEVHVTDGNLPAASLESASLWCRHCHLADVALIGAAARQKQRMASKVGEK